MMEIVYGTVLLSCAWKSALFGVLLAVLFPLIRRWREAAELARLDFRLGLALSAGGAFGVLDLLLFCVADGFPPRIVQSALAALLVAATAGTVLIWRQARPGAGLKA